MNNEIYISEKDRIQCDSDEEELPDEHFKCDRCNAIKHCDEYVSLDNDPTGNTICDACIKEYVKENGLEVEEEVEVEVEKPKEEPIKTMKVGKDKLMYYTGDETDVMNIRVIRFELIKKQKPNEPCACGSGKKHKKCCNAI